MPYTKKTYTDGDILYAADMNNLTEGVDEVMAEYDAMMEEVHEIKDKVGTFVTPKKFGAVGDGITDDTQSMKSFFNHLIDNNVAGYIEPGVYVCSPEAISLTVSCNSFIVFGHGADSIIKRKDMTTTGDTKRLIRINATDNCRKIVLDNFAVDSNARNQQEPPSADSFQHCADITIAGSRVSPEDKWVDDVFITRMHFTDPVADHIWLPDSSTSSNTGIKNIHINGCTFTNRNRFRSDVCASGWVNNIVVSDCDMSSLEFEYNSVHNNEYKDTISISNVKTKSLQLEADATVNVFNVNVTEDTRVWRAHGKFINCYLTGMHGEKEAQIEYTGTTFKFTATDGVVDSMLPHLRCKLIYNNCEFVAPDEYTTKSVCFHPDNTGGQSVAVFNSCRFEDCFTHTGEYDRYGEITYRHCELVGDDYCLKLSDGSGVSCRITIDNCSFNSTYSILSALNNSTGGFIKITNCVCNNIKNALVIRSGSNGMNKFNTSLSLCNRTILTDVTELKASDMSAMYNEVTAKFSGTVPYLLNNDNIVNGKYKWRLTKNMIVQKDTYMADAYIKDPTYGDTSERPKDTKLNAGYCFFDTTLSKPIYYTGSTWVDASGVTV